MSSFPRRPLRIAILGTRGIPARYGGFETFAEQLSRRLHARGHQVTVYRRSRYAGGEVPGVEIVDLPALYGKYTETVSHGLLSILHCAVRRPDVALVCNGVNAAFLPLLSLRGIPRVINVDGLEWQRRKWNLFGRLTHRLSERLALSFSSRVISDARFIEDYYRRRYGAGTTFIPYGGDLQPPTGRDTLDAEGLLAGEYDLFVSRFEPENNPLAVVRARRRLAGAVPLVMVGAATYASAYERRVREEAGPGTRFLGFRFGPDYRELLFGARLLIYAGEVGGTHPVLLEAMAAGLPVVYNATPENVETVGDAGFPYGPGSEDELAPVWQSADGDPQGRRRRGEAALKRVEEKGYRWEKVTDAYERLFDDLARP